jgi:hypothetical protein
LIINCFQTDFLTDKFLFSSEFRRFLTQHQTTSLAQLHTNFNRLNPLTAMIQKQKLLHYPNSQKIQNKFQIFINHFRTDFSAVNLRFQRNYEILKIGERSIQLIETNIQEESLIICFTIDQPKAFVK